MPQAVDITLEGDDGVPVQCHLVVQGLDILCRAVILPDVDTVIRYPGFLIYSPAIHRIGGVTGNVGICHIGNGSAPISGEGNLRLIYRFSITVHIILYGPSAQSFQRPVRPIKLTPIDGVGAVRRNPPRRHIGNNPLELGIKIADTDNPISSVGFPAKL